MGGGSRSRSWIREIARSVYRNILDGRLEGLEPSLARALAEDRLSPGLRESLAGYAREKALEYALAGLPEGEIRRKVAEDVNNRFRQIVEKDRVVAERRSPATVLPYDMRVLRLKTLRPRHVGTWIIDANDRRIITYWFYFEYDVVPIPTPRPVDDEYEPFTIVIDRRSGRVLEYQTRCHWRIVRIDPNVVYHYRAKPVIGFTDLGHTPIPIIDLDRASALLRVPRKELVKKLELLRNLVGWEGEGKPITILRNPLKKGVPEPRPELENVLAKEWLCSKLVEINRRFWIERQSAEEVERLDVHVGPSRKKPPKHDPLRYDWTYIG